MLDSPLFKTAGAGDYEEMEDYLLASDFEAKASSRATAQYRQFQSTTVPEITVSWKSVPFVIAVHPETGKWYIPGTARYGQGLPSLQRVVKKFTQDGNPVESVAPEDDNSAAEEMQRLVEMSAVQNSALEPRGNQNRRETYRDLNNTHNRSLRFLNKTLQEYGYGDYEVWKGEKHMGSTKETYIRFNPLKASFGYSPKGYERSPKYHSYTRYAGDYGQVTPADLAAMIASHRGYDAKFPEMFAEIVGRGRSGSDASWYKWSVSPKTGSRHFAGDIVPDGSEDALEERTEEMEPSSETVTRLKDYDVPTEPPNQNAVREAIETAQDYEVGKKIDQKQDELGGTNDQDQVKVTTTPKGDGKQVEVTKGPAQITINIGV